MPNFSDRNDVTLVEQTADEIAPFVVRVLTPQVLTYLPDHWQPVADEVEALHWLKEQQAETLLIRVAAAEAGLMLIHKTANQWHVGFMLLPEFWGQGVASAAISQLQALAVRDGEVTSLLAGAARSNQASVRVLQKSGFVLSEQDDHIMATWQVPSDCR